MQHIAWLLVLGFLAGFLPARAQQAAPLQLFEARHPAMGSEFTLQVYAPDAATAQHWMDECFDEIDRIEDLLSNYRPSSELSRINREAAAGPVVTDPETFRFLSTSLDWSRRTDGAFDITVGPLMRAWGFFFNSGHVPPQQDLDRVRASTGWRNVQLDSASRSVRFANGLKMELDPGGIGKGYAVDRIAAMLRADHVTAALISAGSSSLYGIGAPPGAPGWRVNVPDPAHKDAVLSVLYLRDQSVSTSACTEKFFIQNGHRYCHILDPATGRPMEDRLQTTVLAPTGTDTDALSTATFVMGPEKSRGVLSTIPGAAALIVSGSESAPRYDEINWPANVSRPACETMKTKGCR